MCAQFLERKFSQSNQYRHGNKCQSTKCSKDSAFLWHILGINLEKSMSICVGTTNGFQNSCQVQNTLKILDFFAILVDQTICWSDRWNAPTPCKASWQLNDLMEETRHSTTLADQTAAKAIWWSDRWNAPRPYMASWQLNDLMEETRHSRSLADQRAAQAIWWSDRWNDPRPCIASWQLNDLMEETRHWMIWDWVTLRNWNADSVLSRDHAVLNKNCAKLKFQSKRTFGKT